MKGTMCSTYPNKMMILNLCKDKIIKSKIILAQNHQIFHKNKEFRGKILDKDR